MDYILLDSELPPGTILDATVPTTEATQPGETTEPDDGLNLEGAVSCSVSGKANVKLNVYNDADDESQEVGSIYAGTAITIVGVKKNGTEIWGIINQNGTQGWINLDGGSCKFEGWVNTNKQPVYVSATTSSGVIGELAANVKVDLTKLSTDGSQVYGWIETESAWIPVSKLNATKPDINTYYSNVGTGTLTTAKTTAEITAYKASNSSEAAFKIGSGYDVGITALDFVGTQVWGKVVIDATTEGWINMNIGNYFTLSVTSSSEMAVYNTKFDKSKPLTVKNAADEDVEVKLPAATTVTVRTLEFDNDGNVWVEVLKSGDVIHNNYIIIRDGDGTPLVSGLG